MHGHHFAHGKSPCCAAWRSPRWPSPQASVPAQWLLLAHFSSSPVYSAHFALRVHLAASLGPFWHVASARWQGEPGALLSGTVLLGSRRDPKGFPADRECKRHHVDLGHLFCFCFFFAFSSSLAEWCSEHYTSQMKRLWGLSSLSHAVKKTGGAASQRLGWPKPETVEWAGSRVSSLGMFSSKANLFLTALLGYNLHALELEEFWQTYTNMQFVVSERAGQALALRPSATLSLPTSL